jgi:tetratricopeptide (TPR) repeat protein
MRLGDWQGARQAFEDAIKDEPDAIPAVYGMGTVLRHLGQPAEAAKQFAKAKEMLEMVQALARAQGADNNGVRLWNSDDLAGAAAAFRASIAAHPAYAEAHNNLGGVLWQQNNQKEAAEEFAYAVRADPKFAKARNNLGNALMVSGNLKGAIEQFQKAVDLEPGFAQGHFSLGIALAQVGQKDRAETEFRQALILAPDLAVAHFELGLLLASGASMLPPVARSEIEEGLRLDPKLKAALPPAVASALATPNPSKSSTPSH